MDRLPKLTAIDPASVLQSQPVSARAVRCGRTRRARAVGAFAGLLASVGGLVAAAAPAAWAGPYVYIDSFVVSGSQADCLSRMRSYLLEAGLTASVVQSMATDTRGNQYQEGWDADHPDKNISATTECDAKAGTGALAVAGMNNEETFQVYRTLHRLVFK